MAVVVQRDRAQPLPECKPSEVRHTLKSGPGLQVAKSLSRYIRVRTPSWLQRARCTRIAANPPSACLPAFFPECLHRTAISAQRTDNHQDVVLIRPASVPVY